jgi:hypothetical protein
VVRKFFPLDKNYLLEQVQLQLESALLAQLFEIIQKHYQWRYNPLGLSDLLTDRVMAYSPTSFETLHPFYLNLAGVYRFKFGQNQLEFLWDGTDHTEQYRKDWTTFFAKMAEQFSAQELFLRAVLDLTVFSNDGPPPAMVESRMNHFLAQAFELKFHKKGLRPARVA